MFVENLGGHKLPTAYPSRRAWLRFIVRDRNHQTIFESGALNPDGPFRATTMMPIPPASSHITRKSPAASRWKSTKRIMQDQDGHVTTGLLSAVETLRTTACCLTASINRPLIKILLSMEKRWRMLALPARGAACAIDPTAGAQGPFEITAELWYQPIGYRWANNLKRYNSATEPRRFTWLLYDSIRVRYRGHVGARNLYSL